jgi:ribosomal protein S18 acetylase RimI-like enzyme
MLQSGGGCVRIELASKEHIEDMCNLLAQLFAIEKDFSPDREKQRKGLNLLLEDEKSVVLIAKRNDKVIGMCTLQFLISTAEGGKVALLEDLVVDAKWRNKGIGSALLRAAEGYCKQHGISRITLLADKDNHNALNFYKKHQWQKANMVVLRRFLPYL